MSQNKIEKLTPDQEAMLPVVRDEWLEIGLSTKRAERQLAEAGVREAYKLAGLEPPALIIWGDSPMDGCMIAAHLEQLGKDKLGVDEDVAPAVLKRLMARCRKDGKVVSEEVLKGIVMDFFQGKVAAREIVLAAR